tara:strand:- start:46 stop:348 length:303 start_codon:yes stop_codon:yes gene_type:complete
MNSFNEESNLSESLLQNSIETVNESEEIANDILNRLGTQREQIESSVLEIGNIDNTLSRSRKVLKNIYFQIIKEKVKLSLIIILLIIIDILLFYLLFIRK